MQWINRYHQHFRAPDFYQQLSPIKFDAITASAFNTPLAEELGLTLSSDEVMQTCAGQSLPPGADPISTAYSGHQFGHWAGQLGDGRAMLLGEVQTASGAFELQLKGAGPTPYSRRGDGFAVIRSTVRDYLASVAMRGLGVPSTDALAMITTAKAVMRENIESAAVLLRVAPSFIRFGHFEHFANHQQAGNEARLKQLADFVIIHYYPELSALHADKRYAALFKAICERTATLIAQWQTLGFCHGVLNTDNMSILGLTLDYGPYGFMDTFDAAHICNHSDSQGRYAFYQQPNIGYWNLSALAHSFSSLVPDSDALKDGLQHYADTFNRAHRQGFLGKLGLFHAGLSDTDADAFIDFTLQSLHTARADFTLFFRDLSQCIKASTPSAGVDFAKFGQHAINPAAIDAWLVQYKIHLASVYDKAAIGAQMLGLNPAIVLRNHLAQEAIEAAEQGNMQPLEKFADALRQPYELLDDFPKHYYQAPSSDKIAAPISCSS